MPGNWVVFIVDRDTAVRDSLRFSIELDGMNARACGSGRELLDHPELDNGCCAVIDGRTLDHDGAEVAMQLEARRHVLPMVLIVDHVSHRQLARMIDVSLFPVVEKPVLDDALLRCVRAVRRI
jgi:FixJ family two-component response regulator